MLDFLSFNIQAGIGTVRARSYVTHAHRQVIMTRPKMEILEKIGDFIRHFDVVCLQEVDLGGRRSGYINQAEYLKNRADFPFLFSQENRKIRNISRHGNVILSRRRFTEKESYSLPGSVPGRGLQVVTVDPHNPITIANTHFSLGESDQKLQFDFINKIIGHRDRVILAGDFNCTPNSLVLRDFDDHSDLDMVTEHHHAYPSWNPKKAIDHIFVSKSFGELNCEVGGAILSDHLPLTMRIKT